MTDNLFVKQADSYAKARPTYPPALFERLASLTKQHERAWDVGTGNGQAARMVAEHYKSVVATDVSEQQLAFAARRPNITYSKMSATPSAEELERVVGPDGSVDLVTVATALHWFDLDKFYPVVKQVLRKPGGVFAAWTYYATRVTPEIDKLRDEFMEQARPYRSTKYDERTWSTQGYKILPFPFEPVGGGGGGGGVEVEYMEMKKPMKLEDMMVFLKSASPVQKALDQGVDLLNAEVRDAWSKAWGEGERSVTFCVSLLLGTVSPASATS